MLHDHKGDVEQKEWQHQSPIRQKIAKYPKAKSSIHSTGPIGSF
jgi:hypothetical protein